MRLGCGRNEVPELRLVQINKLARGLRWPSVFITLAINHLSGSRVVDMACER